MPSGIYKRTEENRTGFKKGNKFGVGKFGDKHPNWKGGKPNCIDCGIKLINAKATRCKICAKKGEHSNLWKGGITPLRVLIWRSFNFRQWRSDIFTRDNFTCVLCGKRGGKIQVDHIEPLSYILKINNIKSLEDSINCSELWNINNGRTLCIKCHQKTDTYGGKANKYVRNI